MRIIYIILLLFMTCFLQAQVTDSFENGVQEWSMTGSTAKKPELKSGQSRSGSYALQLDPGTAVQRRFRVSGLAIVEFEIFARSAQAAQLHTVLSFIDISGDTLMQVKAQLACDSTYKSTGNYTEAPPASVYAVVQVSDSGNTSAQLDDFTFEAHHGIEDPEPSPLVNLDEYMQPFWTGDTVFNETVLLYSENGGAATGMLMYEPASIISVKSYDLNSKFVLGKDFSLAGRRLTAIEGSKIEVVADTFFKKTNLAWYDIQSKWIVVTYTHKDRVDFPTGNYQGKVMPGTLSKLRAKKPLTIAAYGMSITKGFDMSGYDSVPPFMPTYSALFARQLGKAYRHEKIRFYNAALPGATMDWGADNAENLVVPLHADLVILDFGMNDFWRLTPEMFRGYLEGTMKKIKSANPKTEFLLIANMLFDPEYILDSDSNKLTYLRNFDGYRQVISDLRQQGVAVFDMTTLSEAIYNRKKARDCIANPVHPNDYLARWYAQGMSALFIPADPRKVAR